MPATLVGLIVALVAVMMGAQTHHVSPVFLVSNVTALLIVMGGALGATMASFELTAHDRRVQGDHEGGPGQGHAHRQRRDHQDPGRVRPQGSW